MKTRYKNIADSDNFAARLGLASLVSFFRYFLAEFYIGFILYNIVLYHFSLSCTVFATFHFETKPARVLMKNVFIETTHTKK